MTEQPSEPWGLNNPPSQGVEALSRQYKKINPTDRIIIEDKANIESEKRLLNYINTRLAEEIYIDFYTRNVLSALEKLLKKELALKEKIREKTKLGHIKNDTGDDNVLDITSTYTPTPGVYNEEVQDLILNLSNITNNMSGLFDKLSDEEIQKVVEVMYGRDKTIGEEN